MAHIRKVDEMKKWMYSWGGYDEDSPEYRIIRFINKHDSDLFAYAICDLIVNHDYELPDGFKDLIEKIEKYYESKDSITPNEWLRILKHQ